MCACVCFGLFLCQYHTVLITLALWYCLKCVEGLCFQLCSFSSGFLGNSGSSVLPINFRIICSGSVKNVMGNLIGIALNL